MTFLIAAVVTFFASALGIPLLLFVCRVLGLWVVVPERRSYVYVLFGKVVCILDEPGLHFLLARMGPRAFIVNWMGTRHIIDLRLDQRYLRSQPVNSEEGAPMGIGIWFEMFVSDPVAYLFRNADPRGSLEANVSNSTVRCLSNLPLGEMLADRHAMSMTVRTEVSPQSQAWGYSLGSVYIRKVHFRDPEMIRQIESKVVNRLRQVTASIKQDGANQVSIITSSAERQAALEFAKAGAMRPRIVGDMLREVSRDPDVQQALFDVLEAQRVLENNGSVTILPRNAALLQQLVGAQQATQTPPPASPRRST